MRSMLGQCGVDAGSMLNRFLGPGEGIRVTQYGSPEMPPTNFKRAVAALKRWHTLESLVRLEYPAHGVLGLLPGFDPRTHGNLDDDQTHFPENGWTDVASGSHAFFHRHEAPPVQAGHFHVLQGELHLAALAVDWSGLPDEVLTLNRWVSGEHWQPAAATWAAFRRWGPKTRKALRRNADRPGYREIKPREDAELLGGWVAALIPSLEPELRACLRARDQQLSEAIDLKPGVNVLEDRSLEILSRCKIQWSERLAWMHPLKDRD